MYLVVGLSVVVVLLLLFFLGGQFGWLVGWLVIYVSFHWWLSYFGRGKKCTRCLFSHRIYLIVLIVWINMHCIVCVFFSIPGYSWFFISEFMHLVFTHMSDESYRRWFRCLQLVSHVRRALLILFDCFKKKIEWILPFPVADCEFKKKEEKTVAHVIGTASSWYQLILPALSQLLYFSWLSW